MTPNKLNTEATPQSYILEALKQLIPACFTEVKNERGELQQVVDWDTLRQLLGENIVDKNNERYQFTWAGKQAARLEANKVTSQTLRPVPEDSVDWDTTENLYIEGDNLQVLKLLQQGYMGKVKMIYIDPPYNIGSDFVYKDNFAREQAKEDLESGDIDEDGNRYRKNNRTKGRFHSDWCSMIYPRLLIARSLLTEDGVIFISIDDNEVHNLRKICDEVFGEGNFIAELIWKKKSGGANDSKFFAIDHEYIFVYAKNIDNLVINIDKNATVTTSYNLKDEKGLYSLYRLDQQSIRYSKSLDYEIKDKEGISYYPKHKDMNNPNATWRWGKETVKERYEELVFKDGFVYTKNYQKEGSIPRSLLIEDRFGRTRTGKTDFTSLFEGAYFSAPKPYKLIQFLLAISTDENSLILDFFSGSATTAHAVMQLNAEDGGKRKYICIQLEEATPEDSEARKAGYASIPEIARERIRRAGQKIKAEAPLTTQNLDIGFRVLRLDDSNFNEVNRHPNEYDQRQLDLFATNIKEDRNDLDLLFGAMLSWGVPLSLPISTEEIDGCRLYNVNDGDLVACFAENVSEAVVKAMVSKVSLRVLFRDSCFSEDKHKINIFEIFKQQLGWDEKEAMDKIRVI